VEETHNRVVLDPVGLAPRRHDECVVGRDEDDAVDALGLELIQVGQVGGDVLFLAGWGEGARDGDEDYFFGLKFCCFVGWG
jgi:hypothetical protein